MQRLPKMTDDEHHKRERRSNRRAARRQEGLSAAEVPDESCATCALWRHVADMWGECQNAVVTKQRVSAEQYPEHGMEGRTVVARGEQSWWAALTFGQAEPLKTHRTFRACSRYERGAGGTGIQRRTSLVDRVKGEAA